MDKEVELQLVEEQPKTNEEKIQECIRKANVILELIRQRRQKVGNQ